MYDDPIRFTVPVAMGDHVRWLQPDGSLGDEGTAMVFELMPFPTTEERSRIRRLTHEFAGGVTKWVETEQAVDVMRKRVQEGVEALGEDEQPSDTLATHSMVLSELVEVQGLVAFQAMWEVLWRGEDPSWSSLANMRLPAFVADAIRRAHDEALQGVLEGNGLSSAG
jgi:hypothetical protein